MNDTSPAFTVHTPVVELVTDVTPSLLVTTVGVNDAPTGGKVGKLLIVVDIRFEGTVHPRLLNVSHAAKADDEYCGPPETVTL